MARLQAFNEREAAWRGKFILVGKSPAPDDIRLDGNDYLNLTGHAHIVKAQVEALQSQNGAGQFVVQSGVFLGAQHPARRLEQRLAAYIGKDDVHLCQSGYAANIALLPVIVQPGEPAYLDMLAHASLWEGVHNARSTPTPFRHNDVDHLRRQITAKGPGVVIVDSVYSGNGSMCPLVALVELCEETQCTLVVDESHSLGLYGPRGAGLVAELGLTDRVPFITASLAKAFAARAGLFTAPRCLHDYIFTQSFPSAFSSCLLPPEVAGLSATLDLLLEGDAARARLHHVGKKLRALLAEAGFPVSTGTEQIVALEPGDEWAAMQLRDAFERQGIVGAVFCAPAAPVQRPFLRFTPHAGLTDSDMDRIGAAAKIVADETKPWAWASARRQSRATGI